MVGMITPLVQRRTCKVWLQAAAIYTAGGSISSALFGLFVWELGRPLRASVNTHALWSSFAAVSILLALRDWNVLSLHLPERRCQAPHQWLRQYGFGSALFMWGVYIGLGIASFIKFSGFYAVSVALLIVKQPSAAVLTMVFYWFGRVLSLWLAPRLLNTWSIQEITGRSRSDYSMYRALSSLFLLWSAALGVILAGSR